MLPYCLTHETNETKTDGICHKNSTELYNITINDSSECVIKPYDNSSNSQIIIDNNNSNLFLFYNSAKDSDKKLINKFQINENIPLFYEEKEDEIVTETKIYKHSKNIKMTSINKQILSSGNPFLDKIFSGGFQLGSIILLLEDSQTKLYQNFIDINNIANINILACYNVLFSKKGIIHNIASYLIISIILLRVSLLE